jgi:hypothetical protein
MRADGVAAVLAVLCGFTTFAPARAIQLPPSPPCAGEAIIARTSQGTQPAVTVWHTRTLPENWHLASCSGFAPPGDAVLIEVVGSLHHDGDALSLLARLGEVSTQRDILYWNISHGDWRNLLVDATALSGPSPELRRLDFRPDEMRPGARFYLLYDDDERPGPIIFEIEVREARPDGFVTVLRNVTAMRLMGVSIAGPGDLSNLLSIRRIGPGQFAYYGLSAVALAPMAAAMISDGAHINRAVASYRFLAGIPYDGDPPAALK